MTSVGELMTHVVHTAGPNDTVGDLRDLMFDRRLHAVPVVDDGDRLVGIVTSGDLVETWPPRVHVHEVMRAPVHTATRHESLADAAGRMVEHRIHHLPVVEGDQVVGMVSTFDLLQVLVTAS